MLKINLKNIPEKPGVYRFLDSRNKIIYIGQSSCLQKRIASHLKARDPKTKRFIQVSKRIKFQTTATVEDALILEAKLIKKYWPIYNIKEKDDRSWIYIIIPRVEWPKPLLVRSKELGRHIIARTDVFGPYRSLKIAKQILAYLRPHFPYSTCKYNSGKPCFDYQIGLCTGKCLGKIKATDYQKIIRGLANALRRGLKQKLNQGTEKKSFILNSRIEAYDISHLAGQETVGAMVVLKNNNLTKEEYRLFKIKNFKKHDDLSAMREMIERRLNHPEWQLPNLILVDGGKTQIQIAEEALRIKNLTIPVIGIAKFKQEKIIFGKFVSKKMVNLVEGSFNRLKLLRDEAHRFSNRYRKILFRKKMWNL